MLLLLRSAASANPAATLTASGSLSAAGTTGATTLTATGSLTLGSIELHVFAALDGQGNLQGLSQNFLTGIAALTGAGDLASIGGFQSSATLTGLGSLSATVGTVFQGIGGLNAQGGLTAAGSILQSARLDGTGSLSAAGIVTGGIVTPTATLAGIGILSITGAVLASDANLIGTGDLTGFGFRQAIGFATQMRLSFSSDEIRTFFRKG